MELRTRKRGSKWQYSFETASVNGKRKAVSKSGFRTKDLQMAADLLKRSKGLDG